MGSRPHWLVRIAVLVAAIGAVSLAFAVMTVSDRVTADGEGTHEHLTDEDGTNCHQRYNGKHWAAHDHDDHDEDDDHDVGRVWGTTGCLDQEYITTDLDPVVLGSDGNKRRERLWASQVTYPHFHTGPNDGGVPNGDEWKNDPCDGGHVDLHRRPQTTRSSMEQKHIQSRAVRSFAVIRTTLCPH